MIQLAPPLPGPTPVAQAPAGVTTPRVVFVDLARALAVLFMLYGHAVSALLAPEYQAGTWFDLWQVQRGLTAALFLLLAGFAFSIATSRRWSSYVVPSSTLARRLRRFGFYVLLGYALRFPVGSVFELAGATDAQWHAFLAVDVLQLIGMTFIAVQLLVLASQSRLVFTAVAVAMAILLVAATPSVWRIDWTDRLPLWASSFLSPATGSLFPLFPWAGYVLLGTVLGHAYVRWGTAHPFAYINGMLLGLGGVLACCGWIMRPHQVALFGAEGYSYVPPMVLVRAGTCLLIVGAIAHASRSIRRLPPVFGAVAQETLLIYFVHLCIVYGSIWNFGLGALGPTLTPLPMVAVVLALVTSMVLLARWWHGIKQRAPQRARWIAIAAGSVLILRLV